ncbi:hypothetical protein, partial [Paramesorhizobium deserti]|uniref:hypothetical protein n=1 Tax=Paramesorhizobium deserti TaxID=1494590 RepID=UPI00128FF3CC
MAKDPNQSKESVTPLRRSKPEKPLTTAASEQVSISYAERVQDVAPPGNASGDDGSLAITSKDGDSLSAYTWHELTATYTGSDERVKDVVWDAVQLTFTPGSNLIYTDFPYQLYQFDPPRATLIDNGDGTKIATTKFMIYGGFPFRGKLNPDSVAIYARTGDIDPYLFARGIYSVTDATVPSGNILSLYSLEGDPLATGKTFRFFESLYTDYSGSAPSGGNWDGTITWTAKILSGPADATVQFLSQEPTPGSLNGVRVKSSGPVRLQVTATATGTSDTRSVTLMYQKEAVLPSQLSWSGVSDDGSPLSLMQDHGLTFHSGGNFQGPRFWMRYKAYPSDKVTLQKNWSYFGDWGWADNSILVSDATAIPEARIITGVLNGYWTGGYDHAQLPLSFRQDADAINIKPDWQWDNTWMVSNLYTANTINATYSGTKTISKVWWSVDREDNPDYTIVFHPNPSPVTKQADGTLATTTQITAYGPNKPLGHSKYATATAVPDCTIYASALVGDPTQFTMGSSRTFFNATASVPSGNILHAESIEGNSLSQGANAWHVLEATYMAMDGTPMPPSSLTWDAKVTSGSGTVTLAITSGGKTDADGSMTNAIQVTGTGSIVVTVTVQADDSEDVSLPLQLTFEAQAPVVPWQGNMAISSKDGMGLTLAQPHTLSVTYLDKDKNPMPDGTWVAWSGFPSDRLTFGDGTEGSNITLISGGQGAATVTVTASAGVDIAAAVITATAFNPLTALYDHSDPNLVLSFGQGQGSGLIITSPDGASLPLYLPSHP